VSVARFVYTTCRKTGSQWVTGVLGDPQLIAARGVVLMRPYDGYRGDQFATEPDGTLIAPLFDLTYERWRQAAGPDDRCAVVLRDPRDIVVSWAFSSAYSHPSDAELTLVRSPLLALNLRGKLELAAYILKLATRVQLSWVRAAPTPLAQTFRYEDLVADELSVFGAMVEYFGWHVAPDDLAEVVARHTFSARSGGRPRGEKDPFSHYRAATPGDWANYFDRDLAERYEAAMPGVVRGLGYAESDEWWRDQPKTIAGLDAGGVENEALRAERDAALADLSALRTAAESLLQRVEALD
jgi:hypothetical protein